MTRPVVSLFATALLFIVACGNPTKPPPAQTETAARVEGPTSTSDADSDPNASSSTGEVRSALPRRSAACGATPSATRGVHFTTPSRRTFHVWAPNDYDPNRAYPVVLAYHGWYASGLAHESWFKMEDYVDDAAIVVYPDADGPTWDLNGSKDLTFFDEMVATVHASFCTNPSRVFAFGFSYGGKFVNHLGCKRANAVKAISVGDGSWGADGQECGRVPVLVTHRTHDPDELIEWGRDVVQHWKQLDGCETSESGDPKFHCTNYVGCRAPAALTFCEDTDFNPSWPNDWNHTVREPYRAFTWRWFNGLPE